MGERGQHHAPFSFTPRERDSVRIPQNIYTLKRAQNLACMCTRTRAGSDFLPVDCMDFFFQ